MIGFQKIILFAFCTIQLVGMCKAQYVIKSTSLGSINEYNSINTKVTSDSDENSYLVKYNYLGSDNFYSIVKINANLEVEALIEEIAIVGEELLGVSDLLFIENGLLLITIESQLEEVVLNSYLVDLNLSNVSLLKSDVINGGGVELLNFDFIEDKIIGFGNVLDQSLNFRGTVFYEYSKTNNEVKDLLELEEVEILSLLTSFSYSAKENLYLLTYFNGSSVLLDEDLNLMADLDNTYTYTIGNLTYQDLITVKHCDLNFNEPYCIGSGVFGNEFEITISNELDLNNARFLSSSIPFYFEEETSLVQFDVEANNDNQKIAYLTGFHNPFNSQIEENNIYIYLFDEANNLKFHNTFNNQSEIFLRDITGFDNGDFLFVGEEIKNIESLKTENLIIKISKMSSNTNENEFLDIIPVYPNPTQNEVYIEGNIANGGYSVEVINTVGIVVDRQKIETPGYSIDLSNLPKGLYYFSIIENQTQKLYKTRPILKI